MDIKVGNVVKVDYNVEAVVVSKVEYSNNYFVYLIDTNNFSNVKICFEKNEDDNIKFIDVSDGRLLDVLIPLFEKDLETLVVVTE